jgi:tetratricopeptide (TPR) repeat protein
LNKTTAQIADQGQVIEVEIMQMSVYLQCRIIEAVNAQNEYFYLFFYKNKYLTTVKAKRCKRHSHIEHALKNGIIFFPQHPLIDKCLTTSSPFKIKSFAQVTTSITKEFTPHEAAFIFTFFESFFSKKLLFNQIQDIFYAFRRDGQLFSCYKILLILLDFAPNNNWVKQLTTDYSYRKYADRYDQSIEDLSVEDSIFVEKKLFPLIESEPYFSLYATLLHKSAHWSDTLALYMNKICLTPEVGHYEPLIALLKLHLNEEETYHVLHSLSEQLPTFSDLNKDVIEYQLHLNKIDDAIYTILELQSPSPDLQENVIGKFLDQITMDTSPILIEKLGHLLLSIAQTKPEKTNEFLVKCVTILLRSHHLTYIKEWMRPLGEMKKPPQMYEEVNRMYRLSHDPDQQFALGESYYQFKQLTKAIDCFTWSLELNDKDSESIKWLSKIYNELSMEEESAVYRTLYKNLH